MGEGYTFIVQKETRVSFEECGAVMAESSLLHHMERAHGIVMPQSWGMGIVGGG